ncbi:membrane protein insertase YidC [Burkholderia sp. MS455]|uniref:membrane protein insertase YidC n=1 Tax=Burkholderia sp. MS455 TaxID=2811788 RepID=UPI0023BA04BC|nr:membrane protein insertase YidC [Burkholderia sp. MS455]
MAAAGGASGTGATTTAGEVPAAAAGHRTVDDPAPAAQAQLVKFSTDVYDGEIDTRGGTLAKLTLKKQGDGKQPDLYITLFDHTAGHTYLARSGLLGGDFPEPQRRLHAGERRLDVADGRPDTLKLSFESPVKGGVKVIKTYTFTRGSYVLGVDTKIDNVGTASCHADGLHGTRPRQHGRRNADVLAHVPRAGGSIRMRSTSRRSTSATSTRTRRTSRSPADNGWFAMVAALLRVGMDSAGRA